MNAMLESESDELPGYQSLSVTAVLALAFGVLSPAVLLGPLLVLVPCLAVFLALSALWKISRSDGDLTGRGLALAALALSACCLSGWLAHKAASNRLLHAHAQPVAAAWLGHLAAGEVEQAFLLTLSTEQRQAAHAHLQATRQESAGQEQTDPTPTEATAPPAEGPAQQLEEFRQRITSTQLVNWSESLDPKLVSRDSVAKGARGRRYASQTYELRRPNAPPLHCQLTLATAPLGVRGSEWWVANYEVTPAGAP